MNVSDQISLMAKKYPHKIANAVPIRVRGQNKKEISYAYRHYTFSQLEERINKISHRLRQLGVERGQKVLVFIPPSLDFAPTVFALFKIGAICVFIDPGMGVSNLLRAVKEVSPAVIIGPIKAQILRILFFKSFKSIRIAINFSESSFFKSIPLLKGLDRLPKNFTSYTPKVSDMAAILFTSGGTGRPKGVVYTHDIFISQTSMLKQAFNLSSKDIDIPGFPLFAMFTLSLGLSSYIPDMNPSKPRKASGKKLAKIIEDTGATFVAGSPSIWKNLLVHCLNHKVKLNHVRCVCMFGAPIPLSMHLDFKRILVNGTTYTPYGATECLPISNISGETIIEILKNNQLKTKGTCVGYPLKGVDVKIIELSDDEILNMDQVKDLSTNNIGEIIVSSKTTTKSYYNLPGETSMSKIQDGQRVWHRMGDVGYFDSCGRLWFCGRKSHVVRVDSKLMYPIPCEQTLLDLPEIEKCALVQNKNSAAFIIERKDRLEKLPVEQKESFFNKVREKLRQYEHTKDIKDIYLLKELPVDIRHNIKIDRLKLSKLLEAQKIL